MTRDGRRDAGLVTSRGGADARAGTSTDAAPTLTPRELASYLQVSVSTIHSWIRREAVFAVRQGRFLQIPFPQAFPVSATGRKPRPQRAYDPDELKTYGRWHEVLDELAWLIKVSYCSREQLRKRQFRLDALFASYLESNRVSLRRIRLALGTSSKRQWRAIADDLKRGWYNELAYAMPVRPASLGLRFADVNANLEVSSQRMAFPSWRVVQAYYSSYFYLRSLVLQKQPGIRLAEHAAAPNAFKHSVAGAIDGVLWCFPLNITSAWPRVGREMAALRRLQPHWAHAYARHPRAPHRSPEQCALQVSRAFRRRAGTKAVGLRMGLFDYLRALRVWVNYQEIDSMLRLWGGGYRTFLDMNLATLLFFIGGLSELAFIANRGQGAYIRELQRVYDRLTENNDILRTAFVATPVYQRYQVFRQLGVVSGDLALRVEEDPHSVAVHI